MARGVVKPRLSELQIYLSRLTFVRWLSFSVMTLLLRLQDLRAQQEKPQSSMFRHVR